MNQQLLYDDLIFLDNISWTGIFSNVLFRDEIDMDMRSVEIFMPVIFSFLWVQPVGYQVPSVVSYGDGIREGRKIFYVAMLVASGGCLMVDGWEKWNSLRYI